MKTTTILALAFAGLVAAAPVPCEEGATSSKAPSATKTKGSSTKTPTATATSTPVASAPASSKPVANAGEGITAAASVGYATENGGTTGGAAGEQVAVSTLQELIDCAGGDGPAICVVSGTITGNEGVKVTSDKTIIGKDSSAKLQGVGLKVNGKKGGEFVKNVIIRNLAIDKVLAPTDAIGVQFAQNVWVDHCDLQGDRAQSDKDKYDGLFDVTHASDYISITNSYLHNHWKGSLVGHSDSNGDEDTGHLTVTYALNHFDDINSRGPSFRFGTGHILNNLYTSMGDGINTRLGAKLLVEGNVSDAKKPLYSVDDDGFAQSVDNTFSGGENAAQTATVSVPYTYTALKASEVEAAVKGKVGNTLSF